jgi:hypothetical protein
MGQIGIHGHNISGATLSDTFHQSRGVSSLTLLDDPSPTLCGGLGRAISRASIGNYDLMGYVEPIERLPQGGEKKFQVLSLIQGGNHHSQFRPDLAH